jgi:hypothetical protein
VNVDNGASTPTPATTTDEIDNSDAHSIWCNCDECVEVLMVELIEDRVPIT